MERLTLFTHSEEDENKEQETGNPEIVIVFWEMSFYARWLKPTAKDIARNKQVGRSELYLLPSDLADGQDLHYQTQLMSIIQPAQNR